MASGLRYRIEFIGVGTWDERHGTRSKQIPNHAATAQPREPAMRRHLADSTTGSRARSLDPARVAADLLAPTAYVPGSLRFRLQATELISLRLPGKCIFCDCVGNLSEEPVGRPVCERADTRTQDIACAAS